jgi:hypothetical protein
VTLAKRAKTTNKFVVFWPVERQQLLFFCFLHMIVEDEPADVEHVEIEVMVD